MGNNPSTTSDLRLCNGYRSYQLQLGESAAIHFRGREVKQQANGEVTESWHVAYKVDNSTCNFSLTNDTGNTKSLDIRITDGLYGGAKADRCFSVVATRTQAGIDFETDSKTADDNSRTTAVCALGGIIETKVNIYGQGRRRCLMVWERTKKSKQHLKPYMLTVAHYYANSENGKNIGISIAVKRISVSDDGRLDFVVDGPVQHPAAALFDMFDQVVKTGTWKPTYCSHCSDLRARIWQSESEDSDMDNVSSPRFTTRLNGLRQSGKGNLVNDAKIYNGYNNGSCIIINSFLQPEIKDSDRGSVPTPRLHRRRQNEGSILANDGGKMKGKNNGKLKVSGFLQSDESEDRHDVPTVQSHGHRQNGGAIFDSDGMINGKLNICGFLESASEEDSHDVPTTRFHGRKQNGGAILANDGAIHGDHCGNVNIGNAYFVPPVFPWAWAYPQQNFRRPK